MYDYGKIKWKQTKIQCTHTHHFETRRRAGPNSSPLTMALTYPINIFIDARFERKENKNNLFLNEWSLIEFEQFVHLFVDVKRITLIVFRFVADSILVIAIVLLAGSRREYKCLVYYSYITGTKWKLLHSTWNLIK